MRRSEHGTVASPPRNRRGVAALLGRIVISGSAMLAALSAFAWARSYRVPQSVIQADNGFLRGVSSMDGRLWVGALAVHGRRRVPPRIVYEAPGTSEAPVFLVLFPACEPRWEFAQFSWRQHEGKAASLWVATVPYWATTALLALPPALSAAARAARRRRDRRRHRLGLCPACGYDVRASPDRCPECGRVRPATATGGSPAGCPGGDWGDAAGHRAG